MKIINPTFATTIRMMRDNLVEKNDSTEENISRIKEKIEEFEEIGVTEYLNYLRETPLSEFPPVHFSPAQLDDEMIVYDFYMVPNERFEYEGKMYFSNGYHAFSLELFIETTKQSLNKLILECENEDLPL